LFGWARTRWRWMRKRLALQKPANSEC